MAGLNRLIKLCRIFILIWTAECFFANSSLATVDITTPWPVEATENWNSMYGQVAGISLEDGDSVGMFDSGGHCYGAGLVKGGYYFLSAFKFEKGDTAKPNDFAIPGFEDGDTVIFKAYKKSTGEEYVLAPSSGESYTYTYKEEYPPIKIDLAYEETTPTPPPPEEPEDTRILPYYYGGGGTSTETEKTEEKKLGETEELAKKAEEIPAPGKEGTEVSEGMEEPYDVETYEEYGPSDYIEYEEKPSTTARQLEEAVRPRGDATPAYEPQREEEGKEVVVAKETETEHPQEKPSAAEKKPAKKKLPLFAKVVLSLAIIGLAIVLVKRLIKL